MQINYRISGCWPTHEQELLLRAALLQGEHAHEAWEQWIQVVDISSLDYGSFRLLPLLYQNIQSLGIQTDLKDQFKTEYKHTWVNNQRLFHVGRSVLFRLDGVGVKTMLLKGVALVLNNYKDYGLRPMLDFDVLVHPDDAKISLNLLLELGWVPAIEDPEEHIPYSTIGFTRGKYEIDLHWHVLKGCNQTDDDTEFWEGAISTNLRGHPTLILNPTDQLLHTFTHGVVWNEVPPIRWIADAMTILNTSDGNIDWERMVDMARKRQLLCTIRAATFYLHEHLNAQIPQEILDKMSVLRTTRFERIEYRFNTREPKLWEKLTFIRWFFQYYRMMDDQKSYPMRIISFIKSKWGLDFIWQIPFEALRRLMKLVERGNNIWRMLHFWIMM